MTDIKKILEKAFYDMDLQKIKEGIERFRLRGIDVFQDYSLLIEVTEKVFTKQGKYGEANRFKVMDYILENVDIVKLLEEEWFFRYGCIEYEFYPYKRNIEYFMKKGVKIEGAIKENLEYRIRINIHSIKELKEYNKFVGNLLIESEKEDK